jgi:hypothetical protein
VSDPPNELIRIETTVRGVEGEVAIALGPGTRAAVQRDTLDRILSAPLTEAASQLNLVLAARPSAFAFVQPGKDAEGHTRFVVRGQREGDRLVPSRGDPVPSRITAGRHRAKRKRGV